MELNETTGPIYPWQTKARAILSAVALLNIIEKTKNAYKQAQIVLSCVNYVQFL
jgi:hypothetical protein